jgi:D-alanine-D-alanine ligase
MSLHVAVLLGGWSAEREVSLVSGAAVAGALEERGFRVTRIDVSRDLSALLAALAPRPDVVFNALHGRGGEDGTIQGVLDILGLRYTHSGMLASAIAMDKSATKRLLDSVGIRSPKGMVATRSQVLSGDIIPAPYVLKPNNEGSSVGIQIVRPGDDKHPAYAENSSHSETVLIEQYIPGHDLTVAVMGDRALGVTEIRPHSGFYDYSAKYTDGRATHLIPAPAPQEVLDEAMRMALLAHNTLGCSGVSRSDFRWDDAIPGRNGVYFLEINTQPGMTSLSLVPEQAAYLGISFGDLVVWMVENAVCHA